MSTAQLVLHIFPPTDSAGWRRLSQRWISMSYLDSVTADKLSKVCAMFSSKFDGERASAALLADRIVRAAGITWADLITPKLPAPPRPSQDPNWDPNGHMPGEEWKYAVEKILQNHVARLTPWEKTFLMSMADWHGAPTERQAVHLEKIFAKAKAWGAAR